MANREELLRRKKELLLKRKEILESQQRIPRVASGPTVTAGGFGTALGKFRRSAIDEAPDILQATPRTEVISPLLSGLSTAAFNIPKALATEEQQKQVFPEQITAPGKALRFVAETAGILKGGAIGLGKKVGTLAPKGALRAGAELGTFGATQLADDPTVGGQAIRGIGFGLGGAALSKTGQILSKLKSNFIDTKLVPRVTKLFSETLERFPKPIQNFAVNTAKIPSNIVEHISKRLPSNIRQSAQVLDDNADNVFRGMDTRISERGQQVTDAYGNALKNVGNININKSVSKMEKVLTKHGFVDKFGKLTERVKDPLADPILKTIAGEFQALRGASGAGTTIAQRAESVGGVNKFIWENLKDRLSKLNARGGKLTPDITKILDNLHNDAAKAGATGIQSARSLARKFFKRQELVKKFINEKKLDKVFKFTGEELRDFKELDKYLGGGFEQQAKDLIANRSLAKLQQIGQSESFGTQSKLITNLKAAEKKADFGRIKGEFKQLFGSDPEVDIIFNELNAFRKAQTAKKIIGGGLLIGGGLAAGRSLLRRPVEEFVETVGGVEPSGGGF